MSSNERCRSIKSPFIKDKVPQAIDLPTMVNAINEMLGTNPHNSYRLKPKTTIKDQSVPFKTTSNHSIMKERKIKIGNHHNNKGINSVIHSCLGPNKIIPPTMENTIPIFQPWVQERVNF